MIITQPYSPEYYSKVLVLLKSFNETITDPAWQNLLNYPWENKTGLYGTMLINDDEVVGFLSYVISTREVNQQELAFCNISSWVVKDKFRSKSMKLLSKLFEMKNLVVLNLSPHENTLPVFKALRFKTLSEYEYRVNPFKLIGSNLFSRQESKIKFWAVNELNIDIIITDPSQKNIIKDHFSFKNVQFYRFEVVKSNIKTELLLGFNCSKNSFTKGLIGMGQIPYKILNRNLQFELLYSSSSSLLTENILNILWNMSLKLKARIFNISEHFFVGNTTSVSGVSKIKKDRPWFYYSELEICLNDLNLLYSEKVILNF